MKILVVNNVRGDFRYLVQQIENNDVDCVVLVGNSGIYRGDSSDLDVKGIKGYDEEILLNDRRGFKRVLDGGLKLPKPVYILSYVYDNSRLFKSLGDKIENLIPMVSGELYEFVGCRFVGLGGRYLRSVQAGNTFGLPHVEKLMTHENIDLFFMNEPVGGMSKDGSWDLLGSFNLGNREIDIYDINDELNIHVAFFGTDMQIEGDDYISYTVSGGEERFFCWCKSMKQMCYIYDTELRQIIYV